MPYELEVGNPVNGSWGGLNNYISHRTTAISQFTFELLVSRVGNRQLWERAAPRSASPREAQAIARSLKK
jgi:hypothetical protein